MDTSLDDKVAIDLPKAVCLVLFELLTQSYEAWRTSNPNDSSAGPLFVEAREFAQRKASVVDGFKSHVRLGDYITK